MQFNRAFSTTVRRAAGSGSGSGKGNQPTHLESLIGILRNGQNSNVSGKFKDQMNKFGQTPQRKDALKRTAGGGLTADAVRKQTNSLHGMNIPRTGVISGRTVRVQGPAHLNQALSQLRSLNFQNNIPKVVRQQEWHERPGKVKRRLRLAKHHREFDMGIKRLFGLVSEARRKGY